MRILIYSHFYPPEMGGAAARIQGLSKWLASMGHCVTVITSHPNYISGMVDDGLRFRWKNSYRHDDLEVITTWVYASTKRSKWRRLANYFSFVFSATLVGMFVRSQDVILASSPPLFVGLCGWSTSKFHRCKWVLDVRDIWPQLAVEAGEFDANSAIVRWGERLERWLYRSCDRITVVTKNKSTCIEGKGIEAAKIRLVENGVDLDLMEQWIDESCPAIDWGSLRDKFIFSYAGLMGVFQGLDRIVDAAAQFKDNPNVHFLMIGSGVKRDQLVEQAAGLGIRNMQFIDSQPRRMIPGIIARSSIMFVPLSTENLADAVPSKMLEAWACRRPALLIASGESKDLLVQARGGVCVPPNDTERLVQTMVKCIQEPERLEHMGVNGFEFVQRRFDRKQLAKAMEEVCKELI